MSLVRRTVEAAERGRVGVTFPCTGPPACHGQLSLCAAKHVADADGGWCPQEWPVTGHGPPTEQGT